jgi:aldehyde:ferredoxin oxidoreductase
MSPKEIWDATERANNMERLFNVREGLSNDDPEKCDNLVHRYFDEPCLRGAPDVIGTTIDRKKFKKMIDEFYQHHGWDENGIPRPETLKRLDLDNEPSHLV